MPPKRLLDDGCFVCAAFLINRRRTRGVINRFIKVKAHSGEPMVGRVAVALEALVAQNLKRCARRAWS